MARACIRRFPERRWPDGRHGSRASGWITCNSSARRLRGYGVEPIAVATSAISSAVCGRNSCKGGSSGRDGFTGRPCMISNRRGEIGALHRADFIAPERRGGPPRRWRGSSHTPGTVRSLSKNMCSVRHRPMPSAPNCRAMRASGGVLALVRTFATLRQTSPSTPRIRRTIPAAACRPGLPLPGRQAAIHGDHVALLEHAAHGGESLRRIIDAHPVPLRGCRVFPCRAPLRPREKSCRLAS